jgi:hypothetical protein
VRFTLHWGPDRSARITSINELNGHLELLRGLCGRDGAPIAVDLVPAGAEPGGLQIGLGHPERAFVLSLEPGGGAFAVQDDVPGWPEPIAFDVGNELVDFKPEWTRVRPLAVIEAARQYVRTGVRPTGLHFDPYL